MKFQVRQLKDSVRYRDLRSACCALPSDCLRKFQPAITAFLSREFQRQPALSDNPAIPISEVPSDEEVR